MGFSIAYVQIRAMPKISLPRILVLMMAFSVLLASPSMFTSQSLFISPASAQAKQLGYLGKGRDQYKLFVFGDAMAGGLWAGMVRVAKGHPRLRLNGRYREGSGLARPQIYNWATRLPRTLENRSIDIAIVFIGINDGQNIRSAGEYLVFNTPEWKNVYTKSVETMIEQLKSEDIAIYWVESPPVARPDLDIKLKIIANIHKQAAEKLGIRFVSIRKNLTTANDAYTNRGADIYGNLVRLRSRNGIRFIKAGNNKVAKLVLDQIDRDIAIADGNSPVASFPLPSGLTVTADPTLSAYDGPVFAGPTPQGFANIVEPRDLPSANNEAIAVAPQTPTFGSQTEAKGTPESLPSDQILARLKNQTKPGSSAHTLFNQGQWPSQSTTTSRLDDFSLPTQ